jgi:membrane-bound lytic murein transglycosylase D
MVRVRLVLLAALCAASIAPTAGAEALPRPPLLEPNVRFWLRIYTEVDGHGGLIHDSENLDVVYEVVRFPESLSPRSRERRVEQAKKQYSSILRRLASGHRQGLSQEDAHVLARWPEGTSNTTLRRAAERVRFQLGQADRFQAGIVRSGRWRDHIHRVLEEHGIPNEVAALPHVESSFNPRAYSRVGAAGLWQFTRGTGRLYMQVDHVVDERMDPFAATVGAARLLRDNYRRLRAWPLAITAYNHGVGGMERAVRQVGTRDLGVIAQRYQGRTFGFASRNFYAEFLAAADIDRDPERYFGTVQLDPPVEYDVLETDHYYPVATLERALGVDADILHEHNMALRPSVWNGAKLVPRGYKLRVPRGAAAVPFEVALASIASDERRAQQIRDRFHTVGRGETLSRIASRYGVSERELVHLNGLRSRHHIRAGQVLRLPDDQSAPIVVARSEPPADGLYTVRRGDNLSVIAARFGVSVEQVVDWNRLHNRNRLSVGQRLRVGVPQTVVAASPATRASAASAPPAASPTAPVLVALADPALATGELSAPEPPRAETAGAATQALAKVEQAAESLAQAAEPAPGPAGSEAEGSPQGVIRVEALEEEIAGLAAPEEELGEAGVPLEEEPAEAELPIEEPAEAEAPIEEPAEAEAPIEELAEAEAVEVAAVVEASAPEAGVAPPPDAEEVSLLDDSRPVVAVEPASGQALPDPSYFAVTADQRITVQAEETLGHYAEWLEVPTSRLRHLNGMRYSTPLVIGRTKKLDFSRVTPEVFVQRRLAYHRDMQEEFYEAFVVTGTSTHVLRRGDSIWYLANRKYEVPIWLLRQYNPDLDFGGLPAGAQMVIPVVEPRSDRS